MKLFTTKKTAKSILIFFIISIFLLFTNCGKGNKKKPPQEMIPVVVETISLSSISQKIEINGEIKGQNQADIFPDVPGKVLNIFVKEGQYVGQGQVVATVDRSQVGMVYKPATVRSPISGIIGKIYVDKGRTVTQQTPLMMVADTRFVEGVINIPEKHVPLFRRGQRAAIKIESYPNKQFTGIVYKIASLVDPASRTVEVRLRLVNIGGKLVPGNYADFSVTVRTYPNQVTVPVSAVMDAIEYTEVFVVEKSTQAVLAKKSGDKIPTKSKEKKTKNDKKTKKQKNKDTAKDKKTIKSKTTKIYYIARKRKIKIGVQDGGVIQVLSGLKPGDRVITLGKENVIDGSLLRIKKLEKSTNNK